MVTGLAVVALLTAVPAAASMVRRATLEESVRMSDAIVLGRVLGQRTVRLDDGTVATAVRVQVEEGLKGRIGAGSVIEVTAWGGDQLPLQRKRRVVCDQAKAPDLELAHLSRNDTGCHVE
jgi:hypothetical protein